MELVNQILFDSLNISTLLFGISGIVLSILLLVSLNLTKHFSLFFNQYVNCEKKLEPLDKNIQTEHFLYSHNVMIGLGIIAGSVFFLVFLFFKLDIELILKLFKVSQTLLLLASVVLHSMALFGKIFGILGIIIGLLLSFAPNTLLLIEKKLNYWILTKPLEEKLNELHKDTDTICFLHPIVIGTIILISSAFLTVLSILNIIH